MFKLTLRRNMPEALCINSIVIMLQTLIIVN